MFKKLFANLPGRKQRVAATANPADFDGELPGRKIGNALAVIVAVHVAAAGLVFFHHWRLEGRGGDAVAKTSPEAIIPAATLHASGNTSPVPRLAIGDQGHMVRSGETYSVIAEKLGIQESDLRVANNNDPIQTGLILKIPPKKIVAVDPPEVAALRASTPADDRGIVEIPRATPVQEAPRVVKPALPKPTERVIATTPKPVERTLASTPKAAAHAAVASKRSYTVLEGDSLWKIANRYKVTSDQLMKANGISDARKMRTGMTLVIP